MAEFVYNAEQTVVVNEPAITDSSIPCNKGYVLHEDGTGIIILRGAVNNPNSCFARYQVTANCNIALPTGATVGPIAVALSVNGEIKPTSKAIVTPAAVGDYFNVTSTAFITVPRGCCFNIALRNASDSTSITMQNLNIDVNRVA